MKMRQFIQASFMMIFLSCNIGNVQKVNTTNGKSMNLSSPEIFFKDKSKYSKVFIDELNALKYPDHSLIKVIDNVIIIGTDTTKFPDDLKLKDKYLFKVAKGDQSYHLNVKRINESTLNFEFKLFKKNLLVFTDKGEANIDASFFVDPETDVDDLTGKGYSSYEYCKELNDCWFIIRIGVGKDAKNKHRAKVIFGCKEKTKPTLDLKDCPTLRTE